MAILYFIAVCILYKLIFGEGIFANSYMTQEEEDHPLFN
jgi:hypothetical protein